MGEILTSRLGLHLVISRVDFGFTDLANFQAWASLVSQDLRVLAQQIGKAKYHKQVWKFYSSSLRLNNCDERIELKSNIRSIQNMQTTLLAMDPRIRRR